MAGQCDKKVNRKGDNLLGAWKPLGRGKFLSTYNSYNSIRTRSYFRPLKTRFQAYDRRELPCVNKGGYRSTRLDPATFAATIWPIGFVPFFD